MVTAVCEVPGGAHPSYALGYTRRDNAFYQEWDSITRERETFEAWMRRHVLETGDFDDYLTSLARSRDV